MIKSKNLVKALFLMFACLCMGCVAQAAGTNLTLTVHWGGLSLVQTGTVTVQHLFNNGQTGDSWSVDENNLPLVNGAVKLTGFAILPDTVYEVIVKVTTPSTMNPPNANYQFTVSFIAPSLLVDPSKIVAASVSVVIDQTTGIVVPGKTSISITI